MKNMRDIIREYIVYRLTYDMDDFTREHVTDVLMGRSVLRPKVDNDMLSLSDLAQLDPEYAQYN